MAKGPLCLKLLSVTRFKSIHKEAVVELRGLTIVAGANSAGKSSLFQPLLLLKQTLENAYDPGPLLLSGPNVKYTNADQMLWKTTGSERSKTFEVRLEDSRGQAIRLSFKRSGNNFDLASMTQLARGEPFITFRPDMAQTQLENSLPQHLQQYRASLEEVEGLKLKWIVVRERCYFEVELSIKEEDSESSFVSYKGGTPFDVFVRLLTDVIHVPGLRGNPRRSYPSTPAVSGSFSGEFNAYVASIIEVWQREGDTRFKILSEWTRHLGLTWKVSAEYIDESQVRIVVGRMPVSRRGGAKDLVNISDVGFGMSQSLPVLVALLVARPGQTVLIEQPEIHLHPLAQRRMADLIIEAVSRGVRPIIETHSSTLLRALQTSIAKGKISNENVIMHWCSRDEQTGATTVDSRVPDTDGSYGDWPVDFDDVALDVEAEYLDVVESLQG